MTAVNNAPATPMAFSVSQAEKRASDVNVKLRVKRIDLEGKFEGIPPATETATVSATPATSPKNQTSSAMSAASSTETTASLDDSLGGNGAIPVAICGMAMKLPGGINTGEQFWDFLVNKKDGRCRIPADRYNAAAFHGGSVRKRNDGPQDLRAVHDHEKTPEDVKVHSTDARQHGYFLEDLDLTQFDNSLFSMTRNELERLDPQQRVMLELTRECFENAGETEWRGKDIGCYVGMFTEDWLDLGLKDEQDAHLYMLSGRLDALLPNRISYEYDLRGPSMTLKTACSSSLVSLHTAVKALQVGEVTSALVGGCNLIMSPTVTRAMFEQGVLSPNTSCRTFDADADGYARGEAFNMVYVKRLDHALRDGNPIRAVIRATGANADGKTLGLSHPSTEAHENLIMSTYHSAGIHDVHETGFVECHGTGTRAGDPVETKAVAKVWGEKGVYITSVKPNVGHSEGASGITSLIKCVLALEHKTIPPNIKFNKPNPKIPWKEARLQVPVEPTPWPEDRKERVCINSFGLGGSNAHAILDSAESFGVASWKNRHPAPVGSRHRLLVVSAGHAQSAARSAADYHEYADRHVEAIHDLAYTLGVRREHLPYRTFAVADGTGLNEFAAPVKISPTAPGVVFVCTGQGAQWPRMGAMLLVNFPSAVEDLIDMDQTLVGLDPHLAPAWSIREELSKSQSDSRVNKAEFAQPLCTAVQILIINLLRSFGIVPSAVVGHSSGEIAAAYASGALTMREAIICAYLRGLVTTQQKRSGAMAAVGLGGDAVRPYLVDGVVVACENSPVSTTLSGDDDKVSEVIQKIHDADPDVFARKLRVEMAYHSHHMKDLGGQYEDLLAPHLSSKAPLIPFYSSVVNKAIDAKGSLDAAYWRANLESPVLFNSAVQRLLAAQPQGDILLEIGPHSALAGPIRQILKSAKVDTPHLSTLIRNDHDTKSLLTTVGNLFVKGLKIDFLAVNPAGAVLTDLPRYPWHHETHYWHESRLSKDWRLREFPHHDVLGSRALDCSQLEPTWRNLMRLDDIPWCRDHAIGRDIVFPAAGYLVMACEAIRQVTGSSDYSLRDCTISAALVMQESSTVEVMFTMHPLRLTNSLDSKWWEFTVTSYTGSTWVKHAAGQIAPGAENRPEARNIPDLPRKLNKPHWYQVMAKAGLNYGPQFQAMQQISTHPVHRIGVTHVADTHDDDGIPDHFHPSIIDSCLQLYPTVTAQGLARKFGNLCVPTSIKEIYLRSPGVQNSKVTVEVQAELTAKGVIQGDALGIAEDGSGVVLFMKDVKSTPLDDAAGSAPNDPHAGVRLLWKPDIDFQQISSLIHSTKVREPFFPLQKLVLLCCIDALDRLDRIGESHLEHMTRFHQWLAAQVEKAQAEGYLLVDDPASLFELSPANRVKLIAECVAQVRRTDMAPAGTAVWRVYNAIEGLFRGDTNPFEELERDDILNKIHELSGTWDMAPFLRLLSHRTPNLRVLEIGAGDGTKTQNLLKHFAPEFGERAFYSYTVTASEEESLKMAREKLKDMCQGVMEFRMLDITKDPIEQGFQPGKFDLVVASKTLHFTPNLGETLRNVRKLLHPDGKLLLQEVCSESKWINFAMGIFPKWWLGEADGRNEEPYVKPDRWTDEILDAGFSTLDAAIVDDEGPFQYSTIIVASPSSREHTHHPRSVSLLTSQPDSTAAVRMSAALQCRGLSVDFIRPGDTPKQPVITILDLEGKAFLSDISSEDYLSLKTTLLAIPSAGGLLWLTRPCQIECDDPQYAASLGLLRVLRNEISAVDFTSMELDEIDSLASTEAIVNVWKKVQAGRLRQDMEEDMVDPDCEFAFSRRTVHIPRMQWVQVGKELAGKPKCVTELDEDAEDGVRPKALEIGKRGSLKTIQWVEKPAIGVLEGDEVMIEVRATGMNFKDVLIAMGFVDGNKADGNGLGVECAGVVKAVGPAVSNLKAGDRVMSLAGNSYSTVLKTLAPLCAKLPDDLSFEDAATMPCVYATVIYGLLDLARLEPEQSVLIHSASGGVGIAAIQIARMVGAEIYATVGNPEKVKFLMESFDIPRHRIFDSRSISFQKGVMRATNGKGVDVVLNSLSGELLHASWKCVAEFGSMVELGKRDFIGQGRLEMDMFEENRAFFGVHLAPLCERQPQKIRRIMSSIIEYFQEGHIQPIRPTRFFDAVEVEEAFRIMQKGQHIGKFVVRMPAVEKRAMLKTAILRQSLQLRSDASYLLVGGLGGLGRSLSTWMAEHGATNLVYLSRSGGMKPEDQDLVDELAAAGCAAQIIKGSVTEIGDVRRAVSEAHLPIRGVIQASMVLRDKMFADITHDDWEAVSAPKVQGTWNLHHVLAGHNLDFFLLFSSVSGLMGSLGQANYASANTFLDAFVQYRRAKGLPASVLDIGPVGGVGHVSTSNFLQDQFKSAGAYVLAEMDVLDAVELAIRKDVAIPSPTPTSSPASVPGSPRPSRDQRSMSVQSSIPLPTSPRSPRKQRSTSGQVSVPGSPRSPRKQSTFGSPSISSTLQDRHDSSTATYVATAQLGIGMRCTVPIDSAQSRVPWRRDPRMAAYRNVEEVSDNDPTTASDPQDDPIRAFRVAAEASPRSLAEDATVATLARLVGETLLGFMMRPLDDLDALVDAPMTAVGMDSLVAVELRSWCRQRLGLDVTVLEIVNAASITGLARGMTQGMMVKLGVGTMHGGSFVMKENI